MGLDQASPRNAIEMAVGNCLAGLGAPPVLEVRRGLDSVVVVLQGEIDLHNCGEVREVLERECGSRPGRLFVDLSRVSFLDSTGIHVLFAARKLLRDWSGLRLCAPSAPVQRALAVSGLESQFRVDGKCVEDALSRASSFPVAR